VTCRLEQTALYEKPTQIKTNNKNNNMQTKKYWKVKKNKKTEILTAW